jgi:hypothetical protein
MDKCCGNYNLIASNLHHDIYSKLTSKIMFDLKHCQIDLLEFPFTSFGKVFMLIVPSFATLFVNAHVYYGSRWNM